VSAERARHWASERVSVLRTSVPIVRSLSDLFRQSSFQLSPTFVAKEIQMAKRWYCWRIGSEISMLTENEWRGGFRDFNPMEEIKRCIETLGCSLGEAQERIGDGRFPVPAFERHRELTGETFAVFPSYFLAQMASYGPPCPNCNKPFRTPCAKLCAECGFDLPKGARAESLGKLEDY